MKFIQQLLIACVFSLLASSCATLPKPIYKESVVYIDYKTITDQTGVFLTEAPSIAQSYEGMGSVSVFTQGGYTVTNITDDIGTKTDPVYGEINDLKKNKIKYGNYKNPTANDAILLAAETAKEMGANGIINLQIRFHSGDNISISITGMAIKTN